MNALTAYQENSVITQSQGRIVVLLYEGAIKFLNQAVEAMEAGDYVEKGRLINKAIPIIVELSVSLDMDTGAELAQNLRSLYAFMVEHLTKANIDRDAQGIRDVVSLLEELLEGWRVVAD